MKVLFISLLFLIQNAGAQKPLYFYTNNLYDKTKINKDAFDTKFQKEIKELLISANLSNTFFPVMTNSHEMETGDMFIKLYSSYQYLTTTANKPLAKFIVYKRNWQTPFYYSYFIARNNSSFNSFNDFQSVKTLYLQKNSMSGYYSALYKLWEMNIIKNPSVRSLEDELNKKVIVVSTADSVIDLVSEDESSIGATGEEIFNHSSVEVKLVNQVLPQDVICISSNFDSLEGKITNLISNLFSDTNTIKNLHLYVTKVAPFSQTYKNSYKLNESIITIVNQTKNKFDQQAYISRIVPFDTKINFNDIVIFFGKVAPSVYLWLIGILFSIYVLGYNTGEKLLPKIEKIKNVFKFNGKKGNS